MPGRWEFLAALALFGLLLMVKLIGLALWQFNSDEPQHLHVIWAWARGFVQYRDIFDNHMPLFHIMLAPIFGLIGDRASILVSMRLVLFPMYLVTAWCTYQIGALLYSRRVGVWAVILCGLFIPYLVVSSEFRTDNVWAPLWLLCLVVLLRGTFTVRSALVAGMLMGLCFAISLKSMLLLLAISVSLPITFFLGRKKFGQSWTDLGLAGLVFLSATLVIPAIIAGAFALSGLWSAFRHCVFDHNALWRMDGQDHRSWALLIFPVAFCGAIVGARFLIQTAADAVIAFRRGFLLLICGFYLPALYSFWRFITRQDYLPFDPLIFVFASAAILAVSRRLTNRWPDRPSLALRVRVSRWGRESRPVPLSFRFVTGVLGRVSLPAAIALFELLLIFYFRRPWRDTAETEKTMLRDILTLTDPSDYIVDPKGEGIFRQRALWPVMESVTLVQLKSGRMSDDTAERCVATQACVAIAGRMSAQATNFIRQNYLPVAGKLRVAGAYLRSQSSPNTSMEFEVTIPASYKIIAPDVPVVTGVLDGDPYQGGACFLAAGKHTFVQSSSALDLALLWAKAVDRHFTPFEHGVRSHG
jgi:Dolichyl-phosphate-mannose-protein mannosyltransferase